MRTLIAVGVMLAMITGASAQMHGHGGHMGGFHGGGYGGGFHGGVVAPYRGFHGGGYRGGYWGGRRGGLWLDGVWCPWPAYYAGECSYD